MRRISTPRPKAVLLVVVGSVAAICFSSIAFGAVAGDSKAKVKVKCPSQVADGKKATCKVVSKLPKGPKGAKGATGAPGPAGAPGLSGYEVVSQTFKEVYIENSGGMRGLSEVKTVACPAGKRVISGGTDLGTNATQNGQQRSVSVSLSGPNGTGTAWTAQLFNNETVGGGTSIDLRIYAICAATS